MSLLMLDDGDANGWFIQNSEEDHIGKAFHERTANAARTNIQRLGIVAIRRT
jgi:hypothetical protein